MLMDFNSDLLKVAIKSINDLLDVVGQIKSLACKLG